MIKQDMNAFRIPEPQGQPANPAAGVSPAGFVPLGRVANRPDVAALRPAASENRAAPQSAATALEVLWARLPTIAVVILLVMAVVVFAMFQFTPVYKSTALVGFGADPSGRPVEERLQASVARLKSWTLADKVILKLNLMRDPEINTALTRRSFYRISTWFAPAKPRTDVVIPPGTGALTLQPALLAQFADNPTLRCGEANMLSAKQEM